jgi:phage-related protein
MSSIGIGVREIRIQDEAGAFRVIYVASLPSGVYVLHCFQKKAQKTSQRDLELAGERLRQVRQKRQQ